MAHSVKAWIKASRLPSQSYLFMPILLGESIYYFQTGRLNWLILILCHLFGLFNQLYIVYANDVADQDSDEGNHTFNLFSGGSRVLVTAELSPGQLKIAARIMAGACVLVGCILTIGYKRWVIIPLILLALFLLWAYSFYPLRLSYRGGGEILQALGVGVLLPLISYYAQAGSWDFFHWQLIVMILPAQFACAISTSLPDEPSDKLSGKRTSSVVFSPDLAKVFIVVLNLVTLGLVYRHTNLGIDNVRIGVLIIIPLVSSLSHLLYMKAEPGTKQLMMFNLLSVFTILSLQLELAIGFFLG